MLNFKKLIFLLLLFVFTGCYHKELKEEQEKNAILISEIEEKSNELSETTSKMLNLESNLVAKTAALQSKVDAYDELENSYIKIMSQLREINIEFGLIEDKELQMNGFEVELNDFARSNEIDSPIAIQVKDKLNAVLNSNKRSLKKIKELERSLTNIETDNSILKATIEALRDHIKAKERIISNYKNNIINLESTIKILENQINLDRNECLTELNIKEKLINEIKSENEDLKISISVKNESIDKYLAEINDLSKKNKELVNKNLNLSKIVSTKIAETDSLNKREFYIPNCSKGYYLIKSFSWLKEKGIVWLKKGNRKYDKEKALQYATAFDFTLKNEISDDNSQIIVVDIPRGRRSGIELEENKKIIINEKRFSRKKLEDRLIIAIKK